MLFDDAENLHSVLELNTLARASDDYDSLLGPEGLLEGLDIFSSILRPFKRCSRVPSTLPLSPRPRYSGNRAAQAIRRYAPASRLRAGADRRTPMAGQTRERV